ncbi:MAG: hypothetical protein QM764_11065 [Chitinophagaceae bacterium]
MKASASTRIWFALMSAMIWIGIYLTGFSTANWLFYLPAIGLTSASIIGFCPVETGIAKLLNPKRKHLSEASK